MVKMHSSMEKQQIYLPRSFLESGLIIQCRHKIISKRVESIPVLLSTGSDRSTMIGASFFIRDVISIFAAVSRSGLEL
jgi:hypothetical protein